MALNGGQQAELETIAIFVVIGAPVLLIVLWSRWKARRIQLALERRMAAKYAAEQEWAEAIKARRYDLVPPTVMWTYFTPQEYVQDLAQMKALGYEEHGSDVFEDGSRRTYYVYQPIYDHNARRAGALQ